MTLNELNAVEIEIDKLNLDPNNCRKHPKKSIEAIKKSVEEFQQYSPIVVRKENMQVIAGNGTLMACKELGKKTIFAVIIDVTEEQAIAIGIADNKSSDLGETNFDVLRDIMSKYEREDFKKIGYTNEKQIDAILKYDSESDEILEVKKRDITCPRCGAKFKK